jgi:hypothetical protein
VREAVVATKIDVLLFVSCCSNSSGWIAAATSNCELPHFSNMKPKNLCTNSGKATGFSVVKHETAFQTVSPSHGTAGSFLLVQSPQYSSDLLHKQVWETGKCELLHAHLQKHNSRMFMLCKSIFNFWFYYKSVAGNDFDVLVCFI